jgi:hypothetical protein
MDAALSRNSPTSDGDVYKTGKLTPASAMANSI